MTLNVLRFAAAWLLAVTAAAAVAHGDEPHGDAPHPEEHASAGPRFETATESFEMVGRLRDATLTLFINRFETNEPVLQAKVEVESGDLKAIATFQPQQGGYVVTEPKFIAALSQPGAHPLVITLTAGDSADLMEATLTQAAPATASDGSPLRRYAMLLAAAAGSAVLAAVLWRARQRRVNAGGAA